MVRWFGHELLPLSGRSSLSARLTDLSRTLGLATLVVLLVFLIRSIGTHPSLLDCIRWVLEGTGAILMGNGVKEAAISICARLANRRGRDFYRKGVMLNGDTYTEIHQADGTLRRYQYGARPRIHFRAH